MKKGLMVSTLGILILSLMIVDVQAGKAWQITSPTLKNPVTIDGRWTDPNEWVDGYPISCGGYGWILVKSDSSFLYVMVDFVKDLGIQAGKHAWVDWDQKNDGGSKPRTDDYELVLNHTGTTGLALRISQGTGSG